VVKKLVVISVATLLAVANPAGVKIKDTVAVYINAPFLKLQDNFVVNVQDIQLKNKEKLTECVLGSEKYLLCNSENLNTYYVELDQTKIEGDQLVIFKPFTTAKSMSLNFKINPLANPEGSK